MPTLSTMDLAMFVLESPERPFNIGPLVLLRPPATAKPAVFADKLRNKMLKRPPGPPFNYQLKRSLLKAPAVEPMADPDLKRHVHRLTLDQASMQQLMEQVCVLHESVARPAFSSVRERVMFGIGMLTLKNARPSAAAACIV